MESENLESHLLQTNRPSSDCDFDSATIPMIFGAEGQKIMHEFYLQNTKKETENFSTLAAEDNQNNITEHKCDNKLSSEEDSYGKVNNDDDVNDAETNDENAEGSGSDDTRFSDEFNSDSEDLEEEMFYKTQVLKFFICLNIFNFIF